MYAHVTHYCMYVLYCVLWYCGTVVLYDWATGIRYCVLWYCGTVVLYDCVTDSKSCCSTDIMNTIGMV